VIGQVKDTKSYIMEDDDAPNANRALFRRNSLEQNKSKQYCRTVVPERQNSKRGDSVASAAAADPPSVTVRRPSSPPARPALGPPPQTPSGAATDEEPKKTDDNGVGSVGERDSEHVYATLPPETGVRFSRISNRSSGAGGRNSAVAGYGALHGPSALGVQARVSQSCSDTTGSVSEAPGDVDGFRPEVQWEFPRAKLYIRHRIGEGSFAEIWRANADGILDRPDQQAVAVKMLKGE